MTGTDEVLDPQMPSEQPDPRDIARAVAMDVADEPEQVGDVVNAIELGDNVTDFRLAADVRGYEGWQWSVTLYHDAEVGTWTVNESSLVPTDDALVPPAWVPWKDRLEPTDLAPTDSIGTDPDDPRLEDGFRKTKPVQAADAADASTSVDKSTNVGEAATGAESGNADGSSDADVSTDADNATNVDMQANAGESTNVDNVADGDKSTNVATNVDKAAEAVAAAEAIEADKEAETDDIVEEFALSRRHVLSPKGRAQVAKRWYEGPRGPKALSTKTADGNLCSTCGFFVPLKGELNRMFGVCANKWSPDDGRVVSVDHGCGEHSEIEPPEPSHLWVQSKPAYDDFHIDVIAQKPRDERGVVEAIEQLDDDQDDEATEEDILANTEPDDGDDEANETQPSGVDASAELEAVVAIAVASDDESGDEAVDDESVDGVDDESDEPVDNTDEESVDGVGDTDGEPVDESADTSVDKPVDSADGDESAEHKVDEQSEDGGAVDKPVDESTDEPVDSDDDGSVDVSVATSVGSTSGEADDEAVDTAAESAKPESGSESETESETESGAEAEVEAEPKPAPVAEQLELIVESTETEAEVVVEETAEPEADPESEPGESAEE
ncbi:DUF3027 domain-containing protein [Bifidobacterium merycicum]|uniref:DUF3027 family protein n=2 Tax=Bifidobacterium merycicum TaxID=78345 RepID=A0A087BDA9_9BIFI|nr:DUF3027 family protein [Bifidobacterium merycicum]SHE65131.1 Protein of unknown function [Bifidobacterium merycicum DSM 6492]